MLTNDKLTELIWTLQTMRKFILIALIIILNSCGTTSGRYLEKHELESEEELPLGLILCAEDNQEQIDWADYNDVDVWKYFIQNEFLFSTDQELSKRFIENAPFSKFYLANDNESPGKIGAWFGWQIVRAYMQNNNVTLQQMLQTDNEDIFKKSKYKPTK